MKEIKCPNCQTVFKIDDDSYYEILKQIKDEELFWNKNTKKSYSFKKKNLMPSLKPFNKKRRSKKKNG